MAEVTNELIYEVLKKLQADMAGVKESLREINGSMNAMRTHLVAQAQDIRNIYTILAHHDARLARIERRLEIVEPV
jgi:hypothetical protein